jgi:phage-related minor tail protein
LGTDLTFRLFGKDVNFSKAMDKGGDAVKGLGKKMEGLSPVADAAGAAAAGALAAGLLSNMDIEASTDKLAAQLGATGKEADRLGKVASGLYQDAWGESMDEVSGAVSSVIASFEDLGDATDAELRDTTAMALDFASIFEVDVAEAAKVAGVAVKSGLAKDAEEAFDLMTASAQKLPQALREEVFSATEEYSQFFGQLGLSGKQAFGLLVQGAKDGQYGIDKTGDAIKEFTIRATDMSTTSKDAYKAIGLDARTMANAILAGGDRAQKATQQIAKGLLAIKDPADRANTAIALFGTPLEDLGTDQIPEFLTALSGAAPELQRVDGAAKKAGQTLNDNAKTSLEAFRRKAMATFSEAAGAIVQFGMDHQAVVVPMLGALASLAGIIFAVGAATRAWAAIQAVVKAATMAWTAVQWALNSALFANPIGLIVLAIVALVAAIVVAWKKSETFRNVVLGVWNAVKAGAAALWGGIKAAWDGIVAATSRVTGWIKKAFGAVAGFFKKWWPLLVVVFTTQLAIVIGLWNRFGSKIIAGVKRYFGIVKTVITTVLRAVLHVVRTVWSGIKMALINPITAGVNAVARIVGRVASTVGRAIRNAVSAAKRALAPFTSVGKGIIDGIVRGVRNGVGALAGAVKGAAEAALKGAKKFLGIGSPSKVFELQVGSEIAAGAAVGIERSAPAVEHAAARMSSGLTAAAASSVGAAGRPALGGGTVNIYVSHPLTPAQVWGTVTNAAQRVPAGSARLPRAAVAPI